MCEQLDGIPLAIELAAARARVLTPLQIAERLVDPIGLLNRGDQSSQARERTLLGSVEWSYNLVSDDARTLLREVSTFVGGWTIDAADAVHGRPALDPLTELVEASLMLSDPLK